MGKLARDLPAVDFTTATPPDIGTSKAAWKDLQDAAAALPGGSALESIALIANVLTLNDSAIVRVLPAGALTADTINRVDLATIADGRVVYLGCGPVSGTLKPITFKHQANAGAGGGELVLGAGADYVVGARSVFLAFQRSGSQLVQLRLDGSASNVTSLGVLTSDVNMGGRTAYNGRFLSETVSAGSYSFTVADKGKLKEFTAACTATVPTSQPGTGTQWAVGDLLYWQQKGSSLIFTLAGGGKPQHFLNHDRAAGPYAMGLLKLEQVTPSFVWSLGGTTSGLAVAGIQRRWDYAAQTNTVNTPAGSTAWANVLTLSHNPLASEKWLYLSTARFTQNQIFSNNGAKIRAQLTSDLGGPEASSAKFQTGAETPGLIIGKVYPATPAPGSQSVTIDIACGSATAGYTASAGNASIVALRLDPTLEFMDLNPGAVGNVTTTAYVDIVGAAHTLAADDYLALVWCQWRTAGSGNFGGLTLAIDRGGVLINEVSMAHMANSTNMYAHLYPFTATAGAHTVKLKAKINSPGGWTGDVQDAGVALLKKSLFQDWATQEDDSLLAAIAPAGYAPRITLSKALQSGWYYLMLGDCHLASDGIGSVDRILSRMTQGGNIKGNESAAWTATGGQFSQTNGWHQQGQVTAVAPTDQFALEYSVVTGSATGAIRGASLALLALAQIP